MPYFLAILGAASGWAVCTGFIAYTALALFLYAANLNLSIASSVLALGFFFAVPASAYMSAAIVEGHCEVPGRVRILGTFAAILAMAVLFSGKHFIDFFGIVAILSIDSAGVQKFLALSALFEGVLWCAGVSALVVTVLNASMELGASWLLETKKRRVAVPFRAIRLLTAIVLIVFLFDRITDLYQAQFDPASIINRMRGTGPT